MNRRDLLIGAAVSGGALFLPKTAQAESLDDRPIWSREFTYDGIRYDGGLLYGFMCCLAEDSSDAKFLYSTVTDAIEESEFGFFEEGGDTRVTDYGTIRAPRVATKQKAWSIDLESTDGSGFEATAIMFASYKKRVVTLAFGVGLSSPAGEMMPILEDTLRFTATKPSRLSDMIPDVDDMPYGFTMTEDGLDGDSELPGVSL